MGPGNGKWFLILQTEDDELYSIPFETRAEAEEALADVRESGYVEMAHDDHVHEIGVHWAGVAQVMSEWNNR